MRRAAGVIAGAALLGLALWQGLVWAFSFPHYILPAPGLVVEALWTHRALIAERAGQLRGGLVRQGVAPGDIDSVLQKIDELARDGNRASSTQQELALRALMELEYRLRRRIESHEYPELLISDVTELPEQYKEMIADYFRELSRQ